MERYYDHVMCIHAFKRIFDFVLQDVIDKKEKNETTTSADEEFVS